MTLTDKVIVNLVEVVGRWPERGHVNHAPILKSCHFVLFAVVTESYVKER